MSTSIDTNAPTGPHPPGAIPAPSSTTTYGATGSTQPSQTGTTNPATTTEPTPSSATTGEPTTTSTAAHEQPPPHNQPGTGVQSEDAGTGANEEYPEQKHAGAVGYGPNYGKGVGVGEKLGGLTEEIKGKVLKKPEVVQHGHDRRTGELKKKEEDAANSNPFENKSEHAPAPATGGETERAAMTAPEGTEHGERQKARGGEGKTKMI